MKKIIKYYLPVVTWCGLIFFLSSQSNLPGASTAVLDFVFKKGAHMFVYGVLYWLIFRAVNGEKKNKSFFVPLIFSLIYALTDEFHQSLIPGRTPTVRDLGFDFLGMIVALVKLKGLI